MTKWRVGSVSMGVSLMLLGVLLFFSQTGATMLVNLLLTWWPSVVILLGIEILLYVFLSRSEKVIVHYDMVSIFFVGLIGSLCIMLAVLSSVGILSELRQGIGSVELTKSLAELKQAVPKEVKQIVVQTADQYVTVQGANQRDVNIFGTYRLSSMIPESVQKDLEQEYASIRTIGETMYITLNEMPDKRGMNHFTPVANVTLVLPQDVKVDLRGQRNVITLDTGDLQNDWVVHFGGNVYLNIPKQANVKLTAHSSDKIEGNLPWTKMQQNATQANTDRENNDDSTAREYVAETTLGQGTHHLQIVGAAELTANVIY